MSEKTKGALLELLRVVVAGVAGFLSSILGGL